jgi:demethylmacrocin O-methyltransferase
MDPESGRPTAMGFLKKLTDGLNYQEFELESYQPTYYDQNIAAIYFCHSLAFIFKGDNTGASNQLGKRW